MKKLKKGFTLIELIAVLVIMAILALIVTPLVMNIIRKARIAADKRSIDAYGRSIELAIAGYLLDTGTFPSSVDQLNIEYSGNEVVCEKTQLNSDSSVYLAGCKVKNRAVEGYTYGTENIGKYKSYKVGDIIQYKGISFYVIEDSDSNSDSIKLLKAEPLSVEEVNEYGGVGTANSHVNTYVPSSEVFYKTADDLNGYGGVQYYSSLTCGYNGTNWVSDGCTTDYAQSEIKYVVDAWKNAKASVASEARLLTQDELVSDLGYEYFEEGTSSGYHETESTPNFVRPSNYRYWLMTPSGDSSSWVKILQEDRVIGGGIVYGYNAGAHCFISSAVRPVIVLPKSALN